MSTLSDCAVCGKHVDPSEIVMATTVLTPYGLCTAPVHAELCAPALFPRGISKGHKHGPAGRL